MFKCWQTPIIRAPIPKNKVKAMFLLQHSKEILIGSLEHLVLMSIAMMIAITIGIPLS